MTREELFDMAETEYRRLRHTDWKFDGRYGAFGMPLSDGVFATVTVREGKIYEIRVGYGKYNYETVRPE